MEPTDAIGAGYDGTQTFDVRRVGRKVFKNALVLERQSFGPHVRGLTLKIKGTETCSSRSTTLVREMKG